MNPLCGGIVTLFIAMIVFAFAFAFATHKASELVQPSNPSIAEIDAASYYEEGETLKISETNFKLAFTLYDEAERKTLNDSRYI